MSRPNKDRIPTASPQAGLNAAFSNLDIAGLPPAPATPPAAIAKPTQIWKMGRVVLRKEKSGRGGKTVIVVHDFATHLPASVIEKVAKTLRQACGCGGTVKGRTIEMQGDQPGRIRTALEAEGFEVAVVR